MYSLWSFVLFFLVFTSKLMSVESIECSQGIGSMSSLEEDYTPYENQICEKTGDKCVMQFVDNASGSTREVTALDCGTPIYTEGAVATGHYCSQYVRSIEWTNETYNYIKCYCDTDLCNSIGSPLHLEMQKMVENVKKSYTECYHGMNDVHKPYTENKFITIEKCPNGCLLRYRLKGLKILNIYINDIEYLSQWCNWQSYWINKVTKTVMISDENGNQTCIHHESEGILCKCHTNGCNLIGSPLAKEMLKMIQNVTGKDTSEWFKALSTTTAPEVSSSPSISNSNGKRSKTGAANSESSKTSQTPWKLIFLVIFVVTLLALISFCICVFLNTGNNQPEEL